MLAFEQLNIKDSPNGGRLRMLYLPCISRWTTGSCIIPVLKSVFRSFTNISLTKKNAYCNGAIITNNLKASKRLTRRTKWRHFSPTSINKILFAIIFSTSHEFSSLRCLIWWLSRQSKFTARHSFMKMIFSRQMQCPVQKATSSYSWD